MITPDDKDWTWVLERPCPECGFDGSTCSATEVADLIRANGATWERLLAEGRVTPGRPSSGTWSSLEYAAHVRDVYRRYDERMALMLVEHDPLFPNWDQDASAIEERYDEQDPASVVRDLVANSSAIADRLDRLGPEDWPRPGRRSDGASFTLDSLSRYLVHDPIHHVWDVTGHR